VADNADHRLTRKGMEFGLVQDEERSLTGQSPIRTSKGSRKNCVKSVLRTFDRRPFVLLCFKKADIADMVVHYLAIGGSQVPPGAFDYLHFA
jgi:tRNA U34 5-carboxymethylaminomethyl modifying enzyme MnmG/GidA